MDITLIAERLDQVQFYVEHPHLRNQIRLLLPRNQDAPRSLQRLALGCGSPRDLLDICHMLQASKDIGLLLKRNNFDCDDLINAIQETIQQDESHGIIYHQ